MHNLNKMTKTELFEEAKSSRLRVIELESQADELKQTIASQQQRISFLQAILDNLPFEVWACNADGRYDFQNARDIAYRGSNTGKFVHEMDGYPQETLAQWREGNQRAFHGEQIREDDERIDDQEKKYYSSFVGPLRVGDAILGIVGVNVDITERIQAEIALRGSEERYRLLFESNPIPMWLFDLESLAFLAVNEAAVQHYGYSRQEFLSMTLKDIRPPEDVPALLEDVSREISGFSKRGVWRHLKKDGTLIDVEITLHTLDWMSRPARLVIANDVTERERMEAALRASEDKFSKAFHTSPDSVNINRLSDGTYMEVNDGFTKVTGYSKEDVIGRTSLEIDIWAYPEDRSRLVEGLRAHGEVVNLEANFRMKDGTEKVGLMSASLIEIDGQPCILSITRDISDRKQMEQTLRESEERYRLLAESSPTGIILHADEKIFYANQAAARMIGASAPEDLLGRNILDFVHPDYKPVVLERARALRDQNLTAPLLEEKFIRLDGTPMYVEAAAVPYLSRGKQAVQVIINDISERKQTEIALREKTEELNRFFNVALDLLCIADTNGYFRRLNPQWEAVLGYSLPELEGRSFMDLVHPDDQASTLAAIGDLNDQKAVLNFVNRYRCKDGSYRWIEWRSYPVGDVIYAAARDITERKQAEEALRTSEERLQQVIRVSRIGIFEHDHLTDTIYASPEYREMRGWESNETVTLPTIIMHVHPDDRERFAQAIALAHNPAGDGYYDLEYRILRRDGSIRWLVARSQTFFEGDGSMRRPVRTVGATLDVTESRKIEEALRLTRFTVESVADAVYWMDPEARIVDVNEAACRSLGYTRDELIGKMLPEIDPGFSLTTWPETWKQIKETGKLTLEAQHRTRDGRLIPVEIIANYIDFGGRELDCAVVRDITERKRMEKALRESEEHYRIFIENLPIGVYRTTPGPKGKYLIVNSYFLRMFGYSSFEDLAEKASVSDAYVNPAERKNFSDNLLAKGRVDRVELRLKRSDGTPLWGAVTASLAYDKNGEAYFDCVIEDITERKQAEMTATHFGHVLDASLNEIYIFDANTFHFIQANQGAQKNLGYSMMELQNLTPMDLKPEFTWESFAKLVAPLLDGEQDQIQFETFHRRKDGSTYPVEVHLQLSTYGTNRVFVAVVLNMTERKQVEAKLQASEARYRAVIESQVDLISRYLPDTTLTFVNDAYCHFFGKAREELLGESYLFMIAPEYREVVRKETEDLAKNPRPLVGEYVNYRYDGQERWIQWAVQCIGDENGRTVEIQAVGRDITERKLAEQEISRLNEALEQRVIERTAQLEAANKELEAFSYSVSHDLRAPLRAVDGFSRILLEDHASQLPEEINRLLKIIRENTQQMGKLIDDLLAFSRLNRQPLNKQIVNNMDLVHQVLKTLQGDLEGRQVEIEIGDLPGCQGDPTLLRQVWMNLLSNALKFTRERDVAHIEIGCEERDQEQVFFVKDNGVGFDMQYAHKLFGVFQRLHRADKFEGTGVGLAIVQRIIHRHGGRVWTEAEPNVGAGFYFVI